MAVTIAKEKYPAFTGEVGVSGKRIILYINYGTGASEASPKWIKLGGLTSNTHSVSAEVKTAQTKDTGYWADGVVTSKTHELDAEVVMRRDNEAQKVIEEFLYDDAITAEKGALQFAVVDLDTKEYIVGKYVPTSWEKTADGEDVVSYSLKATGVGAPVKKTGFVEPTATPGH